MYLTWICNKLRHSVIFLHWPARKSDLWLAVDPWTGTKLHTFSSDGITSATCPVGDSEERAVMIARTGKWRCD